MSSSNSSASSSSSATASLFASSSSSSSSSDASTFFSDLQIMDELHFTGESQLGGQSEQVEEEVVNAYVASFLADESSSSSSSSSSVSGDEKVRTTEVRRALITALKKDGKEDKDQKDTKLCFVNNELGAFDTQQRNSTFARRSDVNVGSALLRFLKRPIHRWRPALTAPAHRGDVVVVGTDQINSNENFLCCFNCPPLATATSEDYLRILSACPITEPARYPVWINDTRILACTFTGSLSLFSFNPESKHIAKTDVLQGIHTREVREVSLCPSQRNLVASTGADRHLCVTDLSTGTLLAQTQLNGVGSSVKWTEFDSAIGVTLDTGRVMFFDIRASLVEPQKNFHLGHLNRLYTHSRYASYYTLLGYANGDIQNVDLRTYRVLSQVLDPYVEGIGMIEPRGNAFVTSGFTDFCVWKQDTPTRTSVWSHSLEVNQFNEDQTLTYTATWAEDDVVIASNSQGYLGTFLQGITDQQVAGVTNQLASTTL